jgi:hypothetical protein
MAFSTPHKAVLASVALVLAACNTHPESVCENAGFCAEGGDSEWIQTCKDEAKLLQIESDSNGCRPLFDDYYACADASFDCQGTTVTFAGCEGKRAALDACLSAARTKTSCGELDAKTAACITSAPDGGAPVLPPACTLARDCEARCFLDHVSDVCAPHVDELSRFTACATTCPP